MLYGRGDDCAVLTRLLTAAQSGDSAALVVRGEAGVGKTALVDWLHHEAAQRGVEVLRCAGVPSESHLPFAGLHQILRPAIHVMPALSRLHQEALNGALGLSGRRGVDPFLVGVAALSLLGELAGDTAVTCLVDDAQWLDPSTADVLRFVARRLDAEGVLMVFTVRDPDEAVFDAPGLPEHRLRGLDEDASSSLLVDRAPMISAEVKARLVEHHAGNPLAIIELAPLLSDDQLSGRDALPDPLPMGGEVERLYAARAADLSQDAQQLLLLAATADTADLDLVLGAGTALGIDAASLQEAEASGLIAAGHGVVVFKHPLVRSAIHQQSTFLERQRGHLAMAALLEGESERRPARAGTWSGRPPDPTTRSPTCSRPPRTGPWPAADPRPPSTGGSGPPSSAGPTTIAPGGCSAPPRSPSRPASPSALGSCWHRGRRCSRRCSGRARVQACWARSRCDTGRPRPPTTSSSRRPETWLPTTPPQPWTRWCWPARQRRSWATRG